MLVCFFYIILLGFGVFFFFSFVGLGWKYGRWFFVFWIGLKLVFLGFGLNVLVGRILKFLLGFLVYLFVCIVIFWGCFEDLGFDIVVDVLEVVLIEG